MRLWDFQQKFHQNIKVETEQQTFVRLNPNIWRHSMHPHYFSLTVSLLVMRVSAKCTEAQTEASTTMFKDCMDEKEAALLERELGPEEEGQQVICDGLASLARVCQPAVDSLARCKGREYADNLVAIHVNSMSGQCSMVWHFTQSDEEMSCK